MKLTALEIKQQTFEKSLRGYDPSEVQAFLNLVASEWEHMNARLKELEIQIDKMNDKLSHYEKVEEALHETLQTARDSAEQKLSGAKKEAVSVVEKAEMEANSIVQKANDQRQHIRQSLLRLLDRRKEIIGGIRSYLDLANDSLEQFSRDEASLFNLPDEEDLDRQIRDRLNTSGAGRKNTNRESQKEPEPSGAEEESKDMDDILDRID
ncbi:MAG: DivIVA domain-containing protein [Balneolaceae bacterium]